MWGFTMKKVVLLFFVILLCFSTLGFYSAFAENQDDVLAKNCKAAYVCDWQSGTEIYSRNEHAHLPIASMCKIMTLLLCFEAESNGQISFEQEITVSEKAASMGGSQVFLAANSKYKINDLVKSICIASANDSCVAMAETIAGSEDLFVKKMNEKAKMLKMDDTIFSNCTGLPKQGQYSCAKDVATMLRELLKYRRYFEFSKIWMDEIHHEEDRITEMANTNKLIRNYQGCDAGKTGYTAEAGYCLAASALRGNMRIVSVVIGGVDSATRFNATKEMFDYSFANFESKCVLEPERVLEETAYVRGGKLKEIHVAPERGAYLFSLKGGTDNINLQFQFEQVKAPVAIGDRVGEVIVYKNGVEAERINLLANENSDKVSYFDSVHDIAKDWCI